MHSARWAIFLQQSTSALCPRKCPRRRWCCASRECTVLQGDTQIASMCSRCLVVMARRGQEPVRHAHRYTPRCPLNLFTISVSPSLISRRIFCSSYRNPQAIDSKVDSCLLFHATFLLIRNLMSLKQLNLSRPCCTNRGGHQVYSRESRLGKQWQYRCVDYTGVEQLCI